MGSLATTSLEHRSAHALSSRPRYSDDHLKRFLEFIGIPGTVQDFRDNVKFEPLAMLDQLVFRTTAKVPWSSIGIQYSTHHSVSLDVFVLFENIVVKRIGGFCFEISIWFETILRSFEYDLYTGCARICESIIDDPTKEDKSAFRGW